MLRSGMHCLGLWHSQPGDDTFLHFAAAFTVLEPRDIMDAFSLSMPDLFNCLVEHEQLQQVGVSEGGSKGMSE